MAKRGFQGVVMRGLRVREHEATVTGREALTSHFVRIHFESSTVFDQIEVWPTAWLRFWIPDPTDPDVEHQRAYTLSTSDPATGRFSCDFVLHEPAGPASAWAATVQPGQQVSLMSLGAKRFEVTAPPPAGYLLVGDAASTPAINAILEVVPPEVSVQLYLEDHDPRDASIPLREHPRLAVHRVPRTSASSLADALERRDWSGWHAWLAPEAASLKALRPVLRKDVGFAKDHIHAQAYWTAGRAMGTFRDDRAQRAE